MTGNVESDRKVLIHWMHEFGLVSSQTSVVLTKDSEEAVSSVCDRVQQDSHS